MVLKPYLQLSRAHTAPLETVPAFIGALLATGEVNLLVAGWGLFGFMYHIAGYSHNSVMDYLKGHDKHDPNKSHHPLNKRGWEFSMGAQILAFSLVILAVMFMGVMLAMSPEGLGVQVLSLGVMAVVSAVFYNHYSKGTTSKAIPITIAHTLVFVIPYLSMGGETNAVFYFLTMFMVVWIFFQIGISGEMKDIATDDVNFLKDNGAEVTKIHSAGSEWYIEPGHASKMSSSLTLGKLAAALIVMIELGGLGSVYIFSFFCLAFFILGSAVGVVRKGPYEREMRMRCISINEGSTLLMFCLVTSPAYGGWIALLIGAASILWVLVLNKVEWGTWVSPRV